MGKVRSHPTLDMIRHMAMKDDIYSQSTSRPFLERNENRSMVVGMRQ